jgi:hypothetical protein
MTRAVRRFENKEERNFSTIWGELFFGQHKKNEQTKNTTSTPLPPLFEI